MWSESHSYKRVQYHVSLLPDYSLLPRSFDTWLWCVTSCVWYLTTVCYHVSLVPDYDVLTRSFGTWSQCVISFHFQNHIKNNNLSNPLQSAYRKHHSNATFFWYLTTVCKHVRLVPDYDVLTLPFGTWLLCVNTPFWYLTAECYHVRLVFDYGV